MSTVYNFNAGPSTLPKEVMESAQSEFLNYNNLGYSIMEASHRSPEFQNVIDTAEGNIRKLLTISDNYSVLFLQGGASTQFSMIPMNFLGEGQSADYVQTGAWSEKAIKEAQRCRSVNISASSKESNYTCIPELDTWNPNPDSVYTHITSNNTIFGTQFHQFPACSNDAPLIADMSSDILSRKLNVNDFGMIYAGAQKNLGPGGVTLVILNKNLLARIPENLPSMLDYNTHIKSGSLYNTPPTFAIYMIMLTTNWIISNGGIDGIEQLNDKKAGVLYDLIDSDDFFSCPVKQGSRSKMNVCFRLPSENLETEFIKSAGEKGMVGLKGHRSVGGVRASIYNAMPTEGVRFLADFMSEFKKLHS